MHDTLIISIILVMTMIIICSMSVRISRAEKRIEDLKSEQDKLKSDLLKSQNKQEEKQEPRDHLLKLFGKTEGY